MVTLQGELEQAVGFRKIIDLIASSQKLLVGHNAFLDLLHTYDKFVGQLPAESDDWKANIHQLFPQFEHTI